MTGWAVIEQSTKEYPAGRIVTVVYGQKEAARYAAGRWTIMRVRDVPDELCATYFTQRREHAAEARQAGKPS